MDNLQKQAKDEKDFKDFEELCNDINVGLNLKYIRDTTPIGIYGKMQLNNNFIQNEKDIVQYVNNIQEKYATCINMANQFHQDIQWNDLEICIELLQKILFSKVLGKSIDEINNKKEK